MIHISSVINANAKLQDTLNEMIEKRREHIETLYQEIETLQDILKCTRAERERIKEITGQ